MKFKMNGNNFDILRYQFKRAVKQTNVNVKFIKTSFGNIRLLDTDGEKEVIINAPDGPNVIEHQENLIADLTHQFRVVCFEFPGTGFSYPNSNYDYSIESGAKLLFTIMDFLRIEKASIMLSCSNGLYGIKAAELNPKRIKHLFLSQTCSLNSFNLWSSKSIPKTFNYPYIGQLVNSILLKKLTKTWYRYALPLHSDKSSFEEIALNAINNGGCFCLSSLVQGLNKEKNSKLSVSNISSTLIWGKSDFTHRKTSSNSILQHLPNCEVIEFIDCGHFPELENREKYLKVVYDRLV